MNPIIFDERRYAAVPFWFWNSEQTEEEITRQLELAHKGGLRGMAVHARDGNRTEYMSARWMELVRHTCLESKRLGLEVWLYDEEGFPSGSVGGRLPAKDDFYKQKLLHFERKTAGEAAKDAALVRAFAINDLNTPIDPESIPENTHVLAFMYEYNSFMIDYLNRDVCEEFMNMTHRKYAKALGEFFGNPITMVYTDDLNHFLRNGAFLSYTDSFEKEFVQRNGYSILDNLPKIVENIEGSYRVRLDYRRTLLHMFNENFVAPMREWSNKHGMLFTGHLSGDEGPMMLELKNFSDVFTFYENENIPGVDDFLTGNFSGRYMRDSIGRLTHNVNAQTGFSIIKLCKRASSVASQLKNGLCSSEVLTSLGWGIPVWTQMAQLQIQLGCGVNIIVPHDCSYSTAGLTKRDHPESCFFQQPYYQFNSEIYRSVNRSMQLLSRGRIDANVLVIHPMTSLWVAADGAETEHSYVCMEKSKLPHSQFYTDYISDISLHLTKLHSDFEFGSEDIMERHAHIEGEKLIIGDASYSIVILPEIINIGRKSLELLNEFSANGGKIIVIGRFPVMVDGETVSINIFKWENASFISDFHELNENILNPSLNFRTLDPSGKPEILLNTRIIDGRQEFFLINFSGKEQVIQVARNDYELFDPLSGKIIENATGEFTLRNFHSCHLLPVGTVAAEKIPIQNTLFASLRYDNIESFEDGWKISFEQDNVLVLDYAINEFREFIRFAYHDAMIKTIGLEFNTIFHVPEKLDASTLYFEEDTIGNILLNGIPLNESMRTANHPATQDLHGYEVSSALKTGENILSYTNKTQRLETIYLTGKFGVRINDESAFINEEYENDIFCDLSEKGYPFYWGTVRYEKEFDFSGDTTGKRLYIKHADGVITASLNGMELGVFFNEPFEFILDEALKQGTNKLVLRLSNTAQNFFGPQRLFELNHSCPTAWRPTKKTCSSDASFSVASFGIYDVGIS